MILETNDNQQEIGKTIGWVAGLIDGEGSISLIISKRSSKRQQSLRVTPRIHMGNTDLSICEKYTNFLDQNNIGHYDRMDFRKFNGGNKDCLMIEVSGFKRVFKLLNLIKDDLAGEKKKRASILYNLISNRLNTCAVVEKATNMKYTEKDIKYMQSFLELTNSKNKRHVTKILNDYTRNRIN